MDALFNSLIIVFIGEMGDKTQLLSLILASQFKKPWTILAGILVATLANHALASWAGDQATRFFSPELLKWILALTFFAFAAWVLVPDKAGDLKYTGHFGAFLTTTISFFLAEMGDKTQLATVALGATYSDIPMVTLGTTLGMLAANAPAVFLGDRFLSLIPMKWVRAFCAFLFLIFGLAILFYYDR